MIKRVVVAAIAAILLSCGPSLSQSLSEEVPLRAVYDVALFDAWATRFRAAFNQRMDAAQPGAIVTTTLVSTAVRAGYKLYKISTTHAAGFNMGGQADGGLLAVPDTIDPEKPIAVAIHGHEMAPWATPPTFMFDTGAWGLSLVNAGYIVWAPVSMIHAPFSHITYAMGGIGNNKGNEYGYVPIWTRMISDNIDAMLTLTESHAIVIPHVGLAALGLSGGAHIAFNLMAYRTDVKAGVFAGGQQPLDWYRREYASMQHERCWDYPGLTSFTQVKALIAPRPIQFQLGETDSWWPNQVPFAPQPFWPTGSTRDVMVGEVSGPMLILQKIWGLKGGGVVEQHLHSGGHVMDVAAAIVFLSDNQNPLAH